MGPVSHGGGGRLGPGARPRRWASTPHGACASPWLRSRGCVWSAPRDTLTAPARPEGCECQPTIPRARVVFSCRPGTATMRCGARAVVRAFAGPCRLLRWPECVQTCACMYASTCMRVCVRGRVRLCVCSVLCASARRGRGGRLEEETIRRCKVRSSIEGQTKVEMCIDVNPHTNLLPRISLSSAANMRSLQD